MISKLQGVDLDTEKYHVADRGTEPCIESPQSMLRKLLQTSEDIWNVLTSAPTQIEHCVGKVSVVMFVAGLNIHVGDIKFHLRGSGEECAGDAVDRVHLMSLQTLGTEKRICCREVWRKEVA